MKLRISEYFILINIVISIFISTHFFVGGFFFLASSISLFLPYYIFNNFIKNKYIYIIIAIVIWVTHYLRVLLLAFDLESFKYPKIGNIGNEDIINSLLKIGFYSFALLLGFCICSLKKRSWKAKINLAEPRKAKEKIDCYLIKNEKYIKPVVAVCYFFLILLATVLQVGVKSDSGSSTAGVLAYLVPEVLVNFISIVYITRYKIHKLFYIILLSTGIILGILGGSKGALAEIGILFLIYLFKDKGNFRINILKISLVSISSILGLFITFSVANQIKYGILFSGVSYGSNIIEIVQNSVLDALKPENFIYFADLVTTRFNGFDGFTASELYQTDLLSQAFDIVNTIRRIINRLVPFDGGIQSISTGKAVGIEYRGFSSDKSFAGALGIFGSINIMAGIYAPFLCFIFGVICSSLVHYASKIKDPDISFIATGLVILMIIESIISGNFDYIITWFIIRLIQLRFFIILIDNISYISRKVKI